MRKIIPSEIRPEEFKSVRYDVKDGAAWITINRPEHLNALDPPTHAEIKWAIRYADSDPEISVLVLTGSGNSFCVGGDLKDMVAKREAGSDWQSKMLDHWAAIDNLAITAVRFCRKPVVAAINGFCVGGGVALMAWCDIQVAVESAIFRMPENKRNVPAAHFATELHNRVPFSKLKYLLMSGKRFSAVDAERWGFITEVVADNGLVERVQEIVRELQVTSLDANIQFKRHCNSLLPPYPVLEPFADLGAIEDFVVRSGSSSKDAFLAASE